MRFSRCPLFACVVLGGILLVSCSKTARAKKAIAASETAYLGAKNALLAGDVTEAQAMAAQSAAHARAAERLIPAGPLHDSIVGQRERSSLLEGLFLRPEDAVLCWMQAISDGENELALRFFDHRRNWRETGNPNILNASEDLLVDMEEVYFEATKRSMTRFREVFANLQFTEFEASIDGDDAEVRCVLTVLGQKQETGFWLSRSDGLWKIYDFMLGERRASAVFGELGTSIGGDVDFKTFFAGKGIFEAFSAIDGAEKYDSLLGKKPLLGHYVRCRENIDLMRGTASVTVPAGRLVKVVNQGKRENGEEYLLVRTPEADAAVAAYGKIAAEMAESVGTDESEVWGL